MGMTILEIGTLELSSYIYDKKPYRINKKKLKTNIELFRMRYGDKISSIV